jgi:Uncharacterized conserved protein
MMKAVRFFTLLSLIFSLNANAANTILVTDVDDTIKLSNVASKTGSALYAFDKESRFAGMSELYHLIARANPDMNIYYLSRAPEWLMKKTHMQFLYNGDFPAGTYIGVTDLPSDKHKIVHLRNIVRENNPQRVILIGDNTQADDAVYNQLAREFKDQGIEFYIFIREVLSGPRHLKNQVGFVSPIEIALALGSVEMIPSNSMGEFINAMVPVIISKDLDDTIGLVSFPYFVDCTRYVWKLDPFIPQFEILKAYKGRIAERCN